MARPRAAPNLTYTPAANYNGVDIKFRASDASLMATSRR